jgi:hypothetical protein
MGLQTASVEQATRTQDPNQAINLDYAEFLNRGSEHFGENATNFIIGNDEIKPQLPSLPNEVTPSEDPNAPLPEGEELPDPMTSGEPMTPEDAGALQADGKSMPDTFPVRNINNLVM